MPQGAGGTSRSRSRSRAFCSAASRSACCMRASRSAALTFSSCCTGQRRYRECERGPDCRGTARAHGGGGASPRFGLAGLPRLAAAAPARSPRSARARAEQAVRRVFCALCGTRCKATARHETVRSGGQCRGGLLQGAWHRWWAVRARRGAALLSSPSSRRSRPPARAPAARASPHAPDGADIRMRRCVGGDR